MTGKFSFRSFPTAIELAFDVDLADILNDVVFDEAWSEGVDEMKTLITDKLYLQFIE